MWLSCSNRWELTVANVEAMASYLLERLTWMNTQIKLRWQSTSVHPGVSYHWSHLRPGNKSDTERGRVRDGEPKPWDRCLTSHLSKKRRESPLKTKMRTSCTSSLYHLFVISTWRKMLVDFDPASFMRCQHELDMCTSLKQVHPILLLQGHLPAEFSSCPY